MTGLFFLIYTESYVPLIARNISHLVAKISGMANNLVYSMVEISTNPIFYRSVCCKITRLNRQCIGFILREPPLNKQMALITCKDKESSFIDFQKHCFLSVLYF